MAVSTVTSQAMGATLAAGFISRGMPMSNTMSGSVAARAPKCIVYLRINWKKQ